MKKLLLILLLGIFLISTLSFIHAETGMLVFQNSTTAFLTIPQYKIWNETGFSFPNGNITPLSGALQWTVLRNNPIRKELILGTLDNASDINVYFYNSTENWTQSYALTTISSVNLTRAFDIQLERISGDVLVAYNNGSSAGGIGYSVWNGTDWYKSGNLTTNLTGRVNWIKMASYRNNNDIMLIAADNNSRLIGMEWNGTNWTTSYLIETIIETPDKECFDVAYENSGDALIVWANATLTTVRFITYSNNSWGLGQMRLLLLGKQRIFNG